MQYRKLPRGEEQISILGLGTSSIGKAGEKEIEATAALALERGVNFFDLASADAAPFAPLWPGHGRGAAARLSAGALRGRLPERRLRLTTDLDAIRRSVAWQMEALRTDYIDFGFLHCLDKEEDLKRVVDNGVLDTCGSSRRRGSCGTSA